MIVGGNNYEDYNDTQIVDLSSQTRSCKNLAEYPIENHGATGAVVSGQPIVCGGQSGPATTLSQCYRYNKATNSWSFLTNMTTTRRYSTSVPVNGKLLIMGGQDEDCNKLFSTEYISPNGDAPQPGPNFPSPRSGHCAVKLSNGKIILIGGALASGKIWGKSGPGCGCRG